MLLNNKARSYLNAYLDGLASSNGVSSTERYFALSDPKEMRLRDAMLESNDFLSMIVVEDVDQIAGQVVNVGNPGLFTGRKAEGRFRRKVGVDGNTYTLKETDSGAALTYQMLSVWANAGSEDEFFNRMQAFTNKSFSLDMLRIGFNGKSAADNTEPKDNPNGEDVNIGWHEIVRDYNAKQIVTDAVTLGKGSDFSSLDAMASALINTLIPQEFRNDPRLTVLVGADLVAAEQYRLYQAADRPTEKIAAQMLSDSIAGRKAMVPPFFPGKRMAITMLDNLHIYTQRGTRYRKAEFSDDRKQFENSYLRMEGYAVETPELYAAYDESAVTIGDVEKLTGGAEE